MLLGTAKLGALLSAATSNQRVAGAVAGVLKEALSKVFQEEGVKGVLQTCRDCNNAMLRAGVQSKEAHAALADYLDTSERRLVSMAAADQLAAAEELLREIERRSPTLLVSLVKAYADTFPAVKIVSNILKEMEAKDPPGTASSSAEAGTGSSQSKAALVAGLPQEEWERRVHQVFPALQGHRVVLVPKGRTE